VWLERAGRTVLGKGRFELLEAIDCWHSISEAARRLGMSYRRAWLLVQSVNEAAGEPLVTAATGGSHGGGAQLTALGKQALVLFREFQDHIRQNAEAVLPGMLLAPASGVVHIAASVSLEEVLGQLLSDYAVCEPSVRVRTIFGAADELAGLILAGAPADLFLAADGRSLERLEQAGLAERRARTALAENTLAVIGPPNTNSRIRRTSDLLRPEIGRVALAARGSPLGEYSHAYLDRAGLYDNLAARALVVDNARGVVAAVRSGRADAGLAYASAAARATDCQVLLRIRKSPGPIRYLGTVLARGHRVEQARALLDFFTAPGSLRRFAQCGFLPLRRSG
jgi:molybdenum ABC transporter molybdate-binding protein